MSIIIIAFPGAPKVDPEALRKEEELNKLIKQKVTGMLIFRDKDLDLAQRRVGNLFSRIENINFTYLFLDIITENGEDIGFSAVFQKMVEEGFEDLPPGGGIHSKYVIEVHLLTCTLA